MGGVGCGERWASDGGGVEVRAAAYHGFEAISERGGVLGAMGTLYRRGKIQEESLD